MTRVAIEKALGNVANYLEQKNVNVEILDDYSKGRTKTLNRYDAIVVTGADENLMGIQDAVMKGQVINADGKTAEQVYNELIDRLR